MTISGSVQGAQINIGALIAGQNPLVGLTAIAVSVSAGNLFGGEIDAGLIGGILNVDAQGNNIPETDTTTPVANRIFFVGLEGKFAFAGLAGFTIRLALSSLGPLDVFVDIELPEGIVLDPVFTGLAINDFTASVQFFSSLPSITNPLELSEAAFSVPQVVPAAQWLPTVEQQVINQAKAVAANPSIGGFLAAFTSPMILLGSATVFCRSSFRGFVQRLGDS